MNRSRNRSQQFYIREIKSFRDSTDQVRQRLALIPVRTYTTATGRPMEWSIHLVWHSHPDQSVYSQWVFAQLIINVVSLPSLIDIQNSLLKLRLFHKEIKRRSRRSLSSGYNRLGSARHSRTQSFVLQAPQMIFGTWPLYSCMVSLIPRMRSSSFRVNLGGDVFSTSAVTRAESFSAMGRRSGTCSAISET